MPLGVTFQLGDMPLLSGQKCFLLPCPWYHKETTPNSSQHQLHVLLETRGHDLLLPEKGRNGQFFAVQHLIV